MEHKYSADVIVSDLPLIKDKFVSIHMHGYHSASDLKDRMPVAILDACEDYLTGIGNCQVEYTIMEDENYYDHEEMEMVIGDNYCSLELAKLA